MAETTGLPARVGCQKVSPGCKNCYAETLMQRYPRFHNTWGPVSLSNRVRTSEANWNKPFQWNRKAEKRSEPWYVFCQSLSDFGEINPALNCNEI